MCHQLSSLEVDQEFQSLWGLYPRLSRWKLSEPWTPVSALPEELDCFQPWTAVCSGCSLTIQCNSHQKLWISAGKERTNRSKTKITSSSCSLKMRHFSAKRPSKSNSMTAHLLNYSQFLLLLPQYRPKFRFAPSKLHFLKALLSVRWDFSSKSTATIWSARFQPSKWSKKTLSFP